MKSIFNVMIAVIFMSLCSVDTMAQEEELPSLGDALKQSSSTVEYLALAMDYSVASMKNMLDLASEEQSEQRKELAASLDELEKNRESTNLDSKTIKGINQAGEALQQLKFDKQTNEELTKKKVRKAYFLSCMVLAMDATAALAVPKDLNLLNKVIKANSGMKLLRDRSIRAQIKTARDQVGVMGKFSKALPVQKDNFMFVRKTCKKIAEEQNFTLGPDITPEDVATRESAISKMESEELDD